MDRWHLAETVSRMDADAEPPWTGSRRVSARCHRFMSVVNNGFMRIHWHRDMDCVSPPKTRHEPIHGGSNPASLRDTVFGGDTQSMPLIFMRQQCLKRCRHERRAAILLQKHYQLKILSRFSHNGIKKNLCALRVLCGSFFFLRQTKSRPKRAGFSEQLETALQY